MADQISREEFIARFKAESQLRDVYMLWGNNEVRLYGKYTYLGNVGFENRGASPWWPGLSWLEYRYTVGAYHALIDLTTENILDVDVPYVKNRHIVAYERYFPNLAAERPWDTVKNSIPSTSLDSLHSGNIDHQELQGMVHLEKWPLKGNYTRRLAIVYCQFLFAMQ